MHAIDAHRAVDVLEPMLPGIFDPVGSPAVQVVVDGARDQHPARLAKPFQPGRDVDRVTEQVLPGDDHVTEIDPDPMGDPAIFRDVGGSDGHAPLQGRGAADRVDDRGELDDEAVAHRLDQAAMMRAEQRLDQLGPQGPHGRQGAGLVGFDQSGVADHVGDQDRRQPSLLARGHREPVSPVAATSVPSLGAQQRMPRLAARVSRRRPPASRGTSPPPR